MASTGPKRDGVAPWERSEFERRADGWGIAFARQYAIPHGSALLVCERSAACIYMCPSTADGMVALDDAALWGAIARQAVHTGKPAMVALPTFGGDGILKPPPAGLIPQAQAARDRAVAYTPWDGYTSEWDRESAAEYWTGRLTTYQQFLIKRAPQIRWLDTLRHDLVQQLAAQARTGIAPQATPALVAERSGDYVLLRNIRGGRRGAYRGGLKLLTLADEYDRPAAVRTLATVGIHVPFHDEKGWVNASIQPGQRGWWIVTWRGDIAGISAELSLAWFHSETHELRVFDHGLRTPLECLLRRNGFIPKSVTVQNHPQDPEALFGFCLIDELEAAPRHKPRKLRHEAAALLPDEYAGLVESLWNPPSNPSIPQGLFKQKSWDEAHNWSASAEKRGKGKACSLCDSNLARGDTGKYCAACSKDAISGMLVDHGQDTTWTEAAIWSLRTLAEKEFGGPPALAQLMKLPSTGAHTDLLMLCRMLAVRKGQAELGAQRRVKAWTEWLASAGLLAEGIRTNRGVLTTAKDGHLCRSLLEKQIDDFLYDNGIEHETEPTYPYDPNMNVSGYRADWQLADGTFIEALGFPDDAKYMAKAEHKVALGAQHGIRVITITQAEVRDIESLLQEWLPPAGRRPRARPVLAAKKVPSARKAKDTTAIAGFANNGSNAANDRSRAERLERARVAVDMQNQGAARSDIAQALGISHEVVATLLRDGKFYADPTSDPRRLEAAENAAKAKARGLTRAQYREEAKLSATKSDEVWRDADVLLGSNLTPRADGV